MTEPQEITARERRRRERKIWRTGLLVSALFHLVVFFAWRGSVIPPSPFAAAGPRAGDDRAAHGAMQALSIQAPASMPVIPPPVPIPVEVSVEPVEINDAVEIDPASLIGDAPGLGDLPGLQTGTGKGDGGNADQGRYRLEPPSPRGMIIPPADRGLRGTEVQVWVFVDEAGHVVADSTRLDPPTRDGDFNRRLIREAAEWVFRPARRAGEAVASWFPYKISM